MQRVSTIIAGVVFAAAALVAAPAIAETAAAEQKPAEKLAAFETGSSKFSDMAKKSAKNALYFLAAIGLAASLYKRYAARNQSSDGCAHIDVIERRPLGNRTNIVLVSVDGRRLLLAQCGEDLKLLSALPPSDGFIELEEATPGDLLGEQDLAMNG